MSDFIGTYLVFRQLPYSLFIAEFIGVLAFFNVNPRSFFCDTYANSRPAMESVRVRNSIEEIDCLGRGGIRTGYENQRWAR